MYGPRTRQAWRRLQDAGRLADSLDGRRIDAGRRLDMFVEGAVIVELKAVEKLLPLREALSLTYLRLSGQRVGLLININTVLLNDEIRRLAAKA